MVHGTIYGGFMGRTVMHQSIETPTPRVPGKGGGFDIGSGQKASISLPPEAGVQIKRHYPWGKKADTIKSSKKRTCKTYIYMGKFNNVLLPGLCSFD